MRFFTLMMLSLLVAAPAWGTENPTMICPSGIASIGDYQAEVLGKCGEPAVKAQREERRFEKVREGGREKTLSTTVTVDEWTFNFGPREFMQLVLFENGRVKRIESLGYGY
ncbi:hypothetical protein GPEL0_01f5277 [Geoanaerobacter pelophilus]|uniref:DUF2845 domain-containing protein n=1 Tax=Geoanaerobacter pelophilus TaxID=60036 RepID=A0ABQ0MNY5_9BACT|nr:DUF2845 domain-containing protein [Geoanaerobacter pelophilus]GAW68786.1 hypothetical protein GPEL0_01f5277 [Geoanaerobacter pelophilus]